MRLDKLPSLQRQRDPRWFAVSVVVHAAVILAVLIYVPPRISRNVRMIELGEPGTEMAYAPPEPAGGFVRERPRPAPAADTVVAAPAAPEAAEPLPLWAPSRDGGVVRDSVPLDRSRRLVPQYGDGRLWVRVGDVEQGRLPAQRGAADVATHVAKVDSALAEKIRSWLDTVPPDSFATRPAPRWTTEIAGQPWGIDGQWIYLGPIKIPTAVLAALPIPSGNYDEAQKAALLQYMRADIMQAAIRARSKEDFERYVKELRERKDIERAARTRPEPPDEPLIP